MRAPVLDSLVKAFAQLGFTTQSEEGAKRLSMSHPDGTWMSAEASVGSNYGYLQVTDRADIHLMIRLGEEAPMLYPHRMTDPKGRELLWTLVDTCEPFRKEWLKLYLDEIA